jgi:tRNA threonylcarbamoyladenosine biosynthesis protein TsaE
VHLTATSPTQLPAIASEILSFAPNNRIFLFYGDMGAGKTTLIKSLCKQLGSNDNITSPTFSIVNQYNGAGASIYHFDFYRLKNEHEALDIGFEEYLYSGNYCFIEWPEKIPNQLPDDFISITIKVMDNNTRQITLISNH